MDFQFNKQILLIEKDSGPFFGLEALLSELLVQVVVKENGIDGLVWLESGNIPDLIIADCQMGLISGRRFVQYLKASGFFHEIPVVAFGESSNHEAIAGMMRAGAHYYLYKPVEIQDLKAKLDRIFHHQQVA